MRTAVRIAHYVGCGLLIVVGGMAALLFGALVLFDDAAAATPDARDARDGHRRAPAAAARRGDRPYPRRRRWALLLAGSVVLFVGSAFLLLGGAYAVGIVGTLLFGAGLAVSVTALVPRWAHLRIAPDGLVLRHVGRTTRWSWNDIENFKGYEVHHQYGSVKQVGFDRRDLTPDRQSLMDTSSGGWRASTMRCRTPAASGITSSPTCSTPPATATPPSTA